MFSLFSYDLYHANLNQDLNIINQYINKIKNKDQGRLFSNVGGWQSHDLIKDDSTIIKLVESIEKHLNIFSKDFNIKKTFFVDNIWININNYKDSNERHFHPGSILSGVFYVKVPKDSGMLKFYNPLGNIIGPTLENKVDKWNEKNSVVMLVKPKENNLFIFPSWLEHSVLPNLNKTEERISFSFNAKI